MKKLLGALAILLACGSIAQAQNDTLNRHPDARNDRVITSAPVKHHGYAHHRHHHHKHHRHVK